MQSRQFAKNVIERGSGKFSAAQPAAVSTAELQYSHSRPCSLCFGNHRKMLAMVFSRTRILVLLSWSSQILLRHVHARLSNSTSAPRRLDVFLSSVPSFCASCERFWPYVLPATAGVSCCLHYSVSVGRHSVFRPR